MSETEQPGGGNKHPMTPERWAQAKVAYEAGASISSIVRDFGMARNTLRNKLREEGWKPSQKAIDQAVNQGSDTLVNQIAAEARANVISIATRKVVEKAEENGTIDAVALTLNDLLTAQPRIAAKAQLLAEESIDKARLNLKTTPHFGPSDKSDWGQFVSGLLTSAERSISMVREIAGLRPGIPSAGSDNDLGLTIEERVIEPTKLPVDANGRAVASGE